VRILFIGNSLTGVNDLPRMLQALVEADGSGISIQYQTQLISASSLEQQWNTSTTLPLLRSQQWEFVVLQEQGQVPYTTPDAMQAFVGKFNNEIVANSSIPLLYLTWARQPDLALQDRENSAFYNTAKKTASEVAPVGPAWQQAKQLLPLQPLYALDGIHAQPAGTYLAACVFYATIFNKSPVGLPGLLAEPNNLGGLVRLDNDGAQALQQIAWQVTKANRAKWTPDWRRTN
jgi:hypothetical protein